jgi:hypothetical protein
MDALYYAEHDLSLAQGSAYAPDELNRDLANELAFERAAADLQDILHIIAERYLRRGVPLTWRLLHAIEAEALADLGLASRHDNALLALFVRTETSAYPCTDELVSVLETAPVPLLFWFVLDVYGIAAPAPLKRAMPAIARAAHRFLQHMPGSGPSR